MISGSVLSNIIQQTFFNLVLGGVIYVLTRAMRCQPPKITFSRPRLEALLALPAAWYPFILLFAIAILQGPTTVGSTPREYSLPMVISQLFAHSNFLLPMFVLLLLRRQDFASIGWSRHNLGRSVLLGVALGGGMTAAQMVMRAVGITSLLDRQHFYAFLSCAIVGFGEETLYRGYLQTRMIAWLGDWPGWLTTGVLMALVHIPSRLFILGLSPLAAVLNVLSLIPVSLLLGYLMLRTGNVVAPGILHLFADWVGTIK